MFRIFGASSAAMSDQTTTEPLRLMAQDAEDLAVLSAQMTLTLQSTFQRAGTDSKPLTRQFTSTATVRNRVL